MLMTRVHERQPHIQIDDLQPDWSCRSFTTSWREGTLTAYAYLEALADQPENGYLLSCYYQHKQPGRRLSDRQRDMGRALVSKVRELMTGQMIQAGWREIGTHQETGKAIWQHASRITAAANGQVQVTHETEQTRDKATAPAPSIESQPTITIDDLSVPPYTPAMKARFESPLTYEASAVEGDVKAIITIRHYRDPKYPGGYLLDERIERRDELAPGRMGKHQEARARALLARLREQVHAALSAADWELRWHTPLGADLWVYTRPLQEPGSSSSEQDSVTGKKKIILVKKTSSRAHEPYTREVSAKLVTFTCARCGKQEMREKFPGRIEYCAECAPLVKKEKTRERVARLRASQSKAKSS
jgi:hypothetical protein